MWPNTGHINPQESNSYSLMGAERAGCFFSGFCEHSKIPLCPPLEKGDKANPTPPSKIAMKMVFFCNAGKRPSCRA